MHYFDYVKVVFDEAYQHGLWQHFDKMDKYIAGIRRDEFKGEKGDETVAEISMEHLWFIFVIYCVGKSVAVFVFMLEIILNGCKRMQLLRF